MAPNYPSTITEAPPRRGSPISRFINTLIILTLLGAVFWLASDRNARMRYLDVENGHLVVKQGYFFPFGIRNYEPRTPDERERYAPVKLPESVKAFDRRSFNSFDELNDDLIDLLLSWARRLVTDREAGGFDAGREYVRRAELLPGRSEADEQTIREVKAEYHFHEGVLILANIEPRIRLGIEKLREAERWGAGKRAVELAQWYAVARAALDAIEAGRRQGFEAVAPAPALDPSATSAAQAAPHDTSDTTSDTDTPDTDALDATSPATAPTP